MSNITTCISSPPDRNFLVVEFFVDLEQWAELNQEDGKLTLEIYPARSGNPWVFDFDEMISLLEKSKNDLIGE